MSSAVDESKDLYNSSTIRKPMKDGGHINVSEILNGNININPPNIHNPRPSKNVYKAINLYSDALS